jgi:hypothetical protein
MSRSFTLLKCFVILPVSGSSVMVIPHYDGFMTIILYFLDAIALMVLLLKSIVFKGEVPHSDRIARCLGLIYDKQHYFRKISMLECGW